MSESLKREAGRWVSLFLPERKAVWVAHEGFKRTEASGEGPPRSYDILVPQWDL